MLSILFCVALVACEQEPAAPTAKTQHLLVSPKAGLGDLITDLERVWATGAARKELPGGIYFDYGNGCGLKYENDPNWGGVFGSPPRAAVIRGDSKSCYGLPPKTYPTLDQVLTNVRDYMPGDATPIRAYRVRYNTPPGVPPPAVRRIYIFQSSALAELPGVAEALTHRVDHTKPGVFQLIITLNPDDPSVVLFWDLSLSQPTILDELEPIDKASS